MQKILIPAFILLAMCASRPFNAHAQPSPAKTQAAPSPSSPPNLASPAGANGLQLATEEDKVSYAIGMNIGANLRRQPIHIDPKILAQGLSDAFAGSPTALTPDQARSLLVQAQQQLHADQEAAMQAAATENLQRGTAFLLANARKPGVVTLPSGLQYQILRQGSGPKPNADDNVLCNYSGSLVDGTEFDSSAKHGHPVTVPVGRLIKGWSQALEMMPVGSKWRLFIPPSLAYGPRGAGSVIPPNATLIFDVELLSIQPQTPVRPATAPATGASTVSPSAARPAIQ